MLVTVNDGLCMCYYCPRHKYSITTFFWQQELFKSVKSDISPTIHTERTATMVKGKCYNFILYVYCKSCCILKHYNWRVRVKKTSGIVQNVLFRSNRKEMKVEFNKLKNFLCTVTSFYTIRHRSFKNSVGWRCFGKQMTLLWES